MIVKALWFLALGVCGYVVGYLSGMVIGFLVGHHWGRDDAKAEETLEHLDDSTDWYTGPWND